MKMNKIIIPAVTLALGAALVGSVSSTLAWFQYSTKAQAAFIGTTVYEAENLEIKTLDGENNPIWKNNLASADVNKLISNYSVLNVVPITTSAFTETSAIASNEAFYGSIERGVAGLDGYGGRHATVNNFIQFKLNVRYAKAAGTSTNYVAKELNLVDLTITDDAGNAANDTDSTTPLDLYKAVRVHFSVGSGDSQSNLLFAKEDATGYGEKVTTNVYGPLDLDNDGDPDKALKYEWESAGDAIVYGDNGKTQVAYNTVYKNATVGSNTVFKHKIGNLPADSENGLEITVTMWIEGWQKLSYKMVNNVATEQSSASATWDPLVYANKHFKVGMRFQADDIPSQNP